MQKSHKVGVTGVKQLSREEVLKMEPHININVLGGIFVPGECSVDPFLAPITMLHEARRLGAQVRFFDNILNYAMVTFAKIYSISM